MTDQLNQDVRKAVEDVLKERDEVAIRQETEHVLTTTLGARVFSTYQEYHGDWIKQLDQKLEE